MQITINDRPVTDYIVGTSNQNGEEYAHFMNKDDALDHVRDLFEDGFNLDEIVWFEATRRFITGEVSRSIKNITIG